MNNSHRRMFRWAARSGAASSLMALGSLHGCNFATFANYQSLFTDAGSAVIQGVSDNAFGQIGPDFDSIVRAPATEFAQALWANAVDQRFPDDIPNNPILRR